MIDSRPTALSAMLFALVLGSAMIVQADEPDSGATRAESEYATHVKWQRIADNWDRIKDRMAARFDELSVEQLSRLDGRREQLVLTLQDAYGITREQAEEAIDSWARDL